MSSVPIQFLFYAYNPSAGACAQRPSIIGDRPNRACIGLPYGVQLNETVIAQTYCPGQTIVDFVTTSPIGMTHSAIRNPSSGLWTMTLTWIPVSTQFGPQGFCAGAIDNSSLQSAPWCITYLVGFASPNLIRNSASPVGVISQSQTIFSIQTTSAVKRPSRNGTNIYFTDSTNNTVIQKFDCGWAPEVTYINFTITIIFPVAPWIPGHSYFVTSDSGVASGIAFCGAENAAINDPTFWTFNISNPVSTTTTTSSLTTTLSTVATSTSLPTIYTTMNLYNTTSTKGNCYYPRVTLIPGSSTLSSPIQFQRSQDFTIVSLIEFICNQKLSMITKWIIKNCTTIICSNSIQLNPIINTKFSELYIPSKTLPYGTYQLELTVTMSSSLHYSTSSFVYVQIVSSNIIANLVQFGTSMITNGYKQDLLLDPGNYSVDPSESIFNASNWKYKYYCRIYGLYMFPSFQGSLIPIGDTTIDPLNPSCFINRTDNQTPWKFNSINSSITIVSASLQSNRTYQFMVYMEHQQNTSLQAIGYVLVTVEDTYPHMILIGCVISTLCSPNLEYQLVNPTTQVALFSICDGICTTIQNITWNIYHGEMNSFSNLTTWTLFNQTGYEKIWFFGTNTSNFTATNQLFLSNPQINLWQFEVVYSFLQETSSSSLNIVLTKSPSNGSCSINPLNGTTNSLFDILCSNWFDDNDIKDYSVYVWKNDLAEKMIVAYSTISSFQVRLPPGDDQTSLLHLFVHIRNQFDCVTEFNLSSITVMPDVVGLTDFINNIQNLRSELIRNPITQLLASQNQNLVGQLIISLAQQLNKMNSENIDTAILNGIPATSISVSTLGSQTSQVSSRPLNESALIEYNKQLNSYANSREYLMTFITKLAITTSNSVQLQATALAQITETTNELTRTTLMTASERCYQLAMALYPMSTGIPYEDVQLSATQLIQCAANVLT
ncbi:unnamed protein product, partial [Adineta steineri]